MTNNPKKKEMKLPDQLIELLKWLIGTVGLGLVAICINHEIQNNELKIKRLEADAKFLEVVTPDTQQGVINDDRKFLEYILTFVTSTDIRIQIQNKLNKKRPTEIKELNNKAKEVEINEVNLAKDNLSEEQRKDFKQVQKSDSIGITEPEKSIETLIVKENEIAPDSEALNDGLEEIDSLQNAITPMVIFEKENDFKLIKQPITKWCKKGYYVEFNDNLRIGVKDLDKNSIVVNFKDIEASRTNPKVLNKSLYLMEGQIWTQEHGNYKFQITLNRIGAAGKNPFTSAAYITVSTYKKTANTK